MQPLPTTSVETKELQNSSKVIEKPKSNDFKRQVKKWGGIILAAIGLLVISLNYWPRFEGQYSGKTGALEIEVMQNRANKFNVTITDNSSSPPGVSDFEAEWHWYELIFGNGIEKRAIIYHPVENRYELVSGCGRTPISKLNWISRMSNAGIYLLLLAVAALILLVMFFVMNEKAKIEPEAIYPMWVAYFGALFGSAGILIIAGEAGIFGFDGRPKNDVAQLILKSIDFLLDIESEFNVLIGLLFIFVFTQWFSYMFSGLSGAARRPRFISTAWRWVALLMAKGFISASALLLSIEVIGRRYFWIVTEPRNLVADVILSLLALLIGLVIFWLVPLKQKKVGLLGRGARRIHKFMRRRMRKGKNEVLARPEKQKILRMPW